MIKDIFTLKKKSWHHYLMEFLWGLTYKNFPNMCPYFWLTVVNVIISPIAVPIWAIIKLIIRLDNTFTEHRARRDEERRIALIEEMRANILQGKLEKQLLILVKDSNWESLSRRERSIRDELPGAYSICNSNELREKYNSLLQQREALRDKERSERYYKQVEAERQAELKRIAAREKFAPVFEPIKSTAKSTQELIAYWVVGIKKLFTYVWIVSLCYLVFKIFYFLGKLEYGRLPWDEIVGVVIGIGLIIVTAIVLLLIGWGIWALCGVIYIWLADKDLTPHWLIKIFKFIFKPITWFLSGIKKLWDILMAMKADNCPGIDWE